MQAAQVTLAVQPLAVRAAGLQPGQLGRPVQLLLAAQLRAALPAHINIL